ncbi:MAG TPA: hypothetical protein VHO94_00735 [Oscillospiraceae bacterium]|nr:hypothetical protein [Oscillospiraceae bacterium]
MDEQIVLCIQQKLVLMTNILNLSKQIEVRCSQPEIELGNLLQDRKVYMDRFDKCSTLLSKLTAELPSEEKEHMEQLLGGKAEPEDCSGEELSILKSVRKFNDYLQQAIALDKNATKHMKKQCDELRVTINKQRKTQENTSLYNIH